MDPLSAAFAAYLNTFSTTVTNSMQAQNNYDVQAHVVEHEGYSIEACSLARVAVLGENTAEQRRRKAEACDHYEMLKGRPSIADQE